MILLLIGTSSTGKTTLAKDLQKTLPGYWQYMALDVFFAGMPEQYGGGINGPLSADPNVSSVPTCNALVY